MLIVAVRAAPVVPNFYSQVAAAMVQASGAINASYPAILKAAFVRRSILSLHSAAHVQALQSSQPAMSKAAMAASSAVPTSTLSLSSDHYGLDRPLLVNAASHQRSFVANAADAGVGSLEPPSSATAATAFVDDLFRLGRVDYSGFRGSGKGLDHGNRGASHKLAAEGAALRLTRCLFDCGIAH